MEGGVDLEAVEFATRQTMLRCGAIVLKHLLTEEDGSSIERGCECGGTYLDSKRVEKTLRTVVGDVRVERTYRRCNKCRNWRVPEDEVLDVINTGLSPGVRRMMAKSGALVCFDKARDMIKELAGLDVTDKEVERVSEAVGADIALREEKEMTAVMADESPIPEASPDTLYIAADGTGVPVLRRETAGRKGKSEDGIARTREAKLGAIFTQSSDKRDKEGKILRDENSTSYAGKIENCEEFGPRLYAEAFRRGWEKARRKVFIADGAPWLWNLADQYFPGATQIVDYYHAAGHLSDLAKLLYPSDEIGRKRWLKPLMDSLWKGNIDKLLNELRLLKLRGAKKEKVDNAVEYFEKNKTRMRYEEFRGEGYFIGSGVVEAGCKSVIGSRLKQSGMHWSVRGANSIIALRCCIESGRFEDYWAQRRRA